MAIFYLIRHGQIDWNKDHRLQGQKNIPMNSEGVRQINELADRLAMTNIKADLIISSPLDRAKTSAGIIADKIGYDGRIVYDLDFLERNFGLLEGTVWSPELNLEDLKYQVEKVSELCDRAKKALEKYTISEDASVMIVSHGAMLAAIKHALSNGKIDYEDRRVPIIQGNVLCCEKRSGRDPRFYNFF